MTGLYACCPATTSSTVGTMANGVLLVRVPDLAYGQVGGGR
ncbi:hypothetical protein AAHZ94_21500 [Streptomyces sp. HSW2009]